MGNTTAQDAFDEIAASMSIQHTNSADLGNATAAYLIAEIEHENIIRVFQPSIHQLIQRFDLSNADEERLIQDLIARLSVGWGGNRYRFVVEGWNDPLKEQMNGKEN